MLLIALRAFSERQYGDVLNEYLDWICHDFVVVLVSRLLEVLENQIVSKDSI